MLAPPDREALLNPLPLRIRDAADLAEQRARHRQQALARALHDSVLAVPLRAPQAVPYAPPRPPQAGAALAARAEQLQRERYAWHLRRLAAQRHRNPVAEAEATRRLQLIEAQLRALARRLAEIPARTRRPGLPHLYLIEVPAHAGAAAETWHLDTHTLPPDLHARLTAYLHSGTRRLPYRVTNGRYRPQRGVPDDTRALLAALWDHAQQGLHSG